MRTSDWISIVDLAAREGVSRQAVHKRLKRLDGVRRRPGPRGGHRVHIGDYERATGRPIPSMPAAPVARPRSGDRELLSSRAYAE